MKVTVKILRFISRHTWWWTVALIVLLAILLTAARLLLPQLGSYKAELEQRVSQVIGQPVQVGDFEVGWHGYGPRFYLHDVRLLDQARDTTLLSFDEAYIDLSLPLTLYRAQVALHNLTLSGIELSLVRQADGRITLGNAQFPEVESGPGGGDGEALFRWLFRQKGLGIEDSRIYWRDLQQGDVRITMSEVNLFLRNQGTEHRLSGSLTLPSTLGGHLRVMAEAQGSVDDFGAWAVDVYAEGTGLELVQWLVDQPGLGMRMVNGQAELELWAGWRDNRLDHLKGYLFMRDAYLAPDQPVPGLSQDVQLVSSLFGEFVWQNRDHGWTLDVDRLRLVMDKVAWEPARLHVAQSHQEDGSEVKVAASFARVDDVSTLLALSSYLGQEQREILLTTKPRGELRNLYLELQLRDNQIEDYFLRGDLNAFALLPWQKFPGFDGLDVSVNLDQDGGVADFGTPGAYLDLRHLFRDFFAIEHLSGRLAWARRRDGVLMELRALELANADAAVRLDGSVFLPEAEASPVVKLLADIKRGNGEAATHYLPAKIMPEKSVQWLDRAIVSGQVTSGAMVLQGPIRQFPFDDGSGRFEVLFNVSDGILDYQAGWPRVEQIETQVQFLGPGLSIAAVAGKVLEADIRQVDVAIPNLRAKPAVLQLQGRAEGSANDVVDFLNKSPLRQRFGSFTEGAQAAGPTQLDLSLTIPLQADTEVQTRGMVHFADSRVDFTRFDVDLSAVSGRVEFSGDGLKAKSLSAQVLGQPASIDIFSETLARDKTKLVFAALGETDYAALQQRLDLFVFDHLEGASRWQGRLEIPHSRDGGVSQPTLKVTSDLTGTRVKLPPPLQKQPGSPRALEVFARFDDQARHWFFDYGVETLTGSFLLQGEAGLNRGELHFNGDAQLPDAPGLRIAGRLAHFAYDDWQVLLEQRGTAGAEAAQGAAESPVRQLDLHIHTAALFGQTLSEVKLQAQHDQSQWTADIDSDHLAGRVWLPDNPNHVVKMELDRLHITKPPRDDDGGAAGAAAIDPATLPPLIINSQQTRYAGLDLGQAELVTRRRPGGLTLERLKLDSEIVNGTLQGSWTETQGHHSAVNAELRIDDLGALLTGLGYARTIKNGAGTGQLALSWDGPLLDYDLATLAGEVSFAFEDGSVLEVEPGAGRFFGLLSISALPRRLKLDFSDFFGKGFAFDYLRGRFDIRAGNAYTENFAMDGPAAKIELNGRVGLLDEDYDQRVKVVPHISSGLPTLAGILTGSLAPAVVVALLEKLTRPEEAAGIYYQVTGSWKDPKIEPVDVVAAQEAQENGAAGPPPGQ